MGAPLPYSLQNLPKQRRRFTLDYTIRGRLCCPAYVVESLVTALVVASPPARQPWSAEWLYAGLKFAGVPML